MGDISLADVARALDAMLDDQMTGQARIAAHLVAAAEAVGHGPLECSRRPRRSIPCSRPPRRATTSLRRGRRYARSTTRSSSTSASPRRPAENRAGGQRARLRGAVAPERCVYVAGHDRGAGSRAPEPASSTRSGASSRVCSASRCIVQATLAACFVARAEEAGWAAGEIDGRLRRIVADGSPVSPRFGEASPV